MKILVASHFYAPGPEGGAERVARRTVEGLQALGHQVDVLAVTQPGVSATHNVHRVDYVTGDLPGIGPMQGGALRKLIWHVKNGIGGVDRTELAQVLDQVKPDVIYGHNFRLLEPDLSNLARVRNIPVVLHLHDYGWICPRNSMFRKGTGCSSQCMDCRILTSRWRAAAEPRDVIAVSDFVQHKYQTNGTFPNSRWHVIRNTVTPPTQVLPPKEMNTFGFIGAIAPDKGIEDLIAAFGTLNRTDLTLRIAGLGAADFTAYLKTRARALGIDDQITWLGQVDKAMFYPSVDCVVVPSRWNEPQSLVIGETLSWGRGLIASDRGGNTEVIKATGGGLLFDPSDSDALAGVIADMADGPLSAPASLDGVLPNTDQFIAQVAAVLEGAVHA